MKLSSRIEGGKLKDGLSARSSMRPNQMDASPSRELSLVEMHRKLNAHKLTFEDGNQLDLSQSRIITHASPAKRKPTGKSVPFRMGDSSSKEFDLRKGSALQFSP